MNERRSFPAEPSSVRQARRFVAGLLAGLGEHTVDRVLLALSELAANAVRHAATPFQVSVEWGDELLRVEVVDNDNEHLPVRRYPSPGEVNGRGLQIVDSLSDQWGVVTTDAGKAVWFTLPLPPRLPSPPGAPRQAVAQADAGEPTASTGHQARTPPPTAEPRPPERRPGGHRGRPAGAGPRRGAPRCRRVGRPPRSRSMG